MKSPQRILHRKNKPQGTALIRKEFHIVLQAVKCQDIACVWGMFMRLELDPSQQTASDLCIY